MTVISCNKLFLLSIIRCLLANHPPTTPTTHDYDVNRRRLLVCVRGWKKHEHTHQDEQWQKLVAQISAVLASAADVELPEGEYAPLPFDAASDVPIDDQR